MNPQTIPTTPTTGRRRRLALAAASLAALGTGLALTAGATASAAGPATASAVVVTADGDLGPRIQRACDRIPNLQIRTENLLARIQGDASTLGSLQWLQAQIDKAAARGRTELVTVLTNRLQVRTDTVAVLQQRAESLTQLQQWCTEHGA